MMLAALACWLRGHDERLVEQWAWRYDARRTRLVWVVCARCRRTLRQWVEGLGDGPNDG